jgi:hypothetical protein
LRSGFQRITFEFVERFVRTMVGREVLEDPFLDRATNSSLALLEESVWTKALESLHAHVSAHPDERFEIDLSFGMIAAWKCG